MPGACQVCTVAVEDFFYMLVLYMLHSDGDNEVGAA